MISFHQSVSLFILVLAMMEQLQRVPTSQDRVIGLGEDERR